LCLAASVVGANVDRLTNESGYPRDFIEAISQRMRKAGLWIGEAVDNMEWKDANDLTFEFYLHSQVALGTVMRELSPDGRCRYLDTETKKPVTEWSPPDEGASARIAVRSMLN
jgi:hypothetical protein